MESIDSASEVQEQQISLLDPTKRYPAVNPDLLGNRLETKPQLQMQETQLQQPTKELQDQILERLRLWYKAAQQLGKDERYLKRIADLAGGVAAGDELPKKAQVAMEQDLALYRAISGDTLPENAPHPIPQQPAVTLDNLRSWYAAARELGKDAAYLERITEIAQAFKQGKPLSDKALAAMQQSLQAYQEAIAGGQPT
jgi:hypothetical protein